MKQYLFCLFLFLTSLSSFASKVPIRFGKISMDELEMKSYEPDTSAVAVVLCKYGYFNSQNLEYYQIKRVKILKKAGVGYAKFSIQASEDLRSRIKVYNLVDGEIVDEKVKGDNIYKEKITEDYYVHHFAIPNVKVGSVFDIEYTQPLLPKSFNFQETIPTKYVELKLEDSQYISFKKRTTGYEQYTTLENNHYLRENMPAFKVEKMINSPENYITKMEFDIQNISIPGYYKEYTTSWESVNDRLASSTYFGGTLTNGSGYLSKISKEIKEKYSDPKEQIQAAYNFVKQVEWNKQKSAYCSVISLSTAFKEKKANSTDINMMLIQLLHKLDLPALPVVTSTRDKGVLHPFYPSFNKLNYTFVRTVIGEEEILLDATEKNLPMGMLPIRCINTRARMVNNESGKWIDMAPKEYEEKAAMYDLTLSEDLQLKGSILYNRKGYEAYNFRNEFDKFSSEDEYLEKFELNNAGLRIENAEIELDEDISKPVRDKYKVTIKNQVQKTGDLIMINPFLLEQMTENPFKKETRNYPVDFIFKQREMIVSNITIPDGYEISEIPEPKRANLPNKAGSISVNHQAIGNKIMTTMRLSINKTIFTPDEYEILKAFYAYLIEKQAEPIVIKKTA